MENEEDILSFWREREIFKKSEGRKGAPFTFYDGPPFASGLPHYGHLLASAVKDAVPRYHLMCGKSTRRRFGWDCHGLPVENLVEKELDLKVKKDIEEYGIERFNAAARKTVTRFTDDWKHIIPRLGRFVDMEDDYRTMDIGYTESVWWVFKTLYERGLIYEGYKAMHLCPRCETTLANFEVNQGYKDITDISVTVALKLTDEPKKYLLAWTTTPWTLPGNVALAINPDIEYVEVVGNESENIYILAKSRVEAVFKGGFTIVKEFQGRDLVGKKYTSLFDYYSSDSTLPNHERGWQVYAADFVTADDGTGIVHIAPAFGEDDYALSQRESLPFVQHVTTDGKMKTEVVDFAGELVKPKDDHQHTDILIIKHLAGKGMLFAKEKIVHSYPHCWRCDTPLLNYAANSWFVKVTDIKEDLIRANAEVNWVPAHIKDGRFGKWLLGARDWAISRSRFWGAPIPVWRCETCGEHKVVGRLDELPEVPRGSGGEPDVHRPFIDAVTFTCSRLSGGQTCGGVMRRVPDVFDCWFESGAMPYGQACYIGNSTDDFDPEAQRGFPADFIAEGLDQTRGWFYSLMVLGVALFKTTPYKNVIVNGLVLAEDGQKMSKKLKNYPDPMDLIARYGADALRYYLLSSPVMRGEDIAFSESGVAEVYRKNIGRLRNVLAFYTTFGAADTSEVGESPHILDRWLRARSAELVSLVTAGFESYEIDQAVKPIADFIDDLSTWYLRRSRERLKEGGEDALCATTTLRDALHTLSLVSAPVMPFIAEVLYQAVRVDTGPESVHLASWPTPTPYDTELLTAMTQTREVASAALELRARSGIKVRQPLSSLTIPESLGSEYEALIRDELNVKDIRVGKTLDLDTVLTADLISEGVLREFMRAVQEARKVAACDPRALVRASVRIGDPHMRELIARERDALVDELLLKDLTILEGLGEEFSVEIIP